MLGLWDAALCHCECSGGCGGCRGGEGLLQPGILLQTSGAGAIAVATGRLSLGLLSCAASNQTRLLRGLGCSQGQIRRIGAACLDQGFGSLEYTLLRSLGGRCWSHLAMADVCYSKAQPRCQPCCARHCCRHVRSAAAPATSVRFSPWPLSCSFPAALCRPCDQRSSPPRPSS